MDKKMPAFDPFGVFIEENSHRVGDPFTEQAGAGNTIKTNKPTKIFISRPLTTAPKP